MRAALKKKNEKKREIRINVSRREVAELLRHQQMQASLKMNTPATAEVMKTPESANGSLSDMERFHEELLHKSK